MAQYSPQINPAMTSPGCDEHEAATGRLVNELFERLKGIKPGWRAAFPTTVEEDNAKAEWLMAIEESGISDWSVIEGALSELRQQPGPFLPSTGDFIALCRRASLRDWNVPSESEAFMMLQQFFGPRHATRDFTKLNRAVYAAYRYMDWSVVSQLPYREQRQAFREAWQRVERDIASGKPLPIAPSPERMLEEKPVEKVRTEVGASTLDDLKSMFGEEETA